MLWHFCGVGEYCQGFPNLFGLGKLGQAFSSKTSVTIASARSFLKEETKGGFVEDQKDLPYTSLFFTQTLKTAGNPAGY